MNSKHQCVQLNDGHFIPVLGFGTLATGEVRILVMGLTFQKKIE
jgi:hypothetical protein